MNQNPVYLILNNEIIYIIYKATTDSSKQYLENKNQTFHSY